MANKPQQKAPDTDLLVQDPEQTPITNEELLALHTSQGEVIARQDAEIAELKDMIRMLTSGKSKPAKRAAGGTIVQVCNEEYRVVHGIRHEGRKLSIEEIAADPDLCAALVASGSTALEQQ